ncbi:MAG: DUF131 domain-containing protein [Thermoplasmata archaeon]|jgi:uncharacterized protein (TIGR00304 family)
MRVLGWGGVALLAAGVALIVDAVVRGGASVSLVVIIPVVSGGSAEFLLGVVALVAGFLLVPLLAWGDTGIEEPEASEPLTSPAAPSSASATTGGLVLVGPVPIFFGSWRNVSTRTRLWVAIAGALVLVLFVVGFLVATR